MGEDVRKVGRKTLSAVEPLQAAAVLSLVVIFRSQVQERQ